MKTEIRPNPGALVDGEGRCTDTDEVVGDGSLHVEQMSEHCFWARLYTKNGKDVVMWFNSASPIFLTAELD